MNNCNRCVYKSKDLLYLCEIKTDSEMMLHVILSLPCSDFRPFETSLGLEYMPEESFQPQIKRTRRYKARPQLTTVYFGNKCAFEMASEYETDIDVWVHELTEHTLASVIESITGVDGLKYIFKLNEMVGRQLMQSSPTIAHLVTSCVTISGFYSSEIFFTLSPDEYFNRLMNRPTYEQLFTFCTGKQPRSRKEAKEFVNRVINKRR